MKCRECRFLVYDKAQPRRYCALHSIKVAPESIILGKPCHAPRYAGIGALRRIFKPWHWIQYAAKEHDEAYNNHPCDSTKEIDLQFKLNCISITNRFYGSNEWPRLNREIEFYYQIVRAYGIGRYALCKLRKWKFLLKK